LNIQPNKSGVLGPGYHKLAMTRHPASHVSWPRTPTAYAYPDFIHMASQKVQIWRAAQQDGQ